MKQKIKKFLKGDIGSEELLLEGIGVNFNNINNFAYVEDIRSFENEIHELRLFSLPELNLSFLNELFETETVSLIVDNIESTLSFEVIPELDEISSHLVYDPSNEFTVLVPIENFIDDIFSDLETIETEQDLITWAQKWSKKQDELSSEVSEILENKIKDLSDLWFALENEVIRISKNISRNSIVGRNGDSVVFPDMDVSIETHFSAGSFYIIIITQDQSYKIRYSDHKPSPFRGQEFGHPDKFFRIDKGIEPDEVIDFFKTKLKDLNIV